MKTGFKLFLSLLCAASPLSLTAQPARLPLPLIAERGPDHRVVQRVVEETLPDGKVISRISSITELESGMHYWEDNQWKETRAEIEIVNGSAVARRGPHKIIFDANLKSAGSIDVETPDGQRLRSHVVGLAYLDAASGQSVMFAEVKDCEGAVLPPNQVWYMDAFEGDCVADVRFSYTKSGYEQDIVFRVAPPSPAQYGLNPETTRINVFTEFIEAPVPSAKRIVLKEESDPVRRQQMAMPDLVDHELDFGVTKFVAGQAFPLDDPDPFGGSSAPTAKLWQTIEGRTFLIEEVEYPAVEPSLRRLPQTAAVNQPREIIGGAMLARLLPAVPPMGPRGKWRNNQYASLDRSRPGLVVDYTALIFSSHTNYSFKADTTYHLVGNVSLYGTTVIEGGTVIKFTNSVAPQLNLYGPLDCKTSSYRPAVFTAGADHTIGEIITNYTAAPSGTYANYALGLRDSTTNYTVHDVHIRYANYAFPILAGVKADIYHAQVGNGTLATIWQANARIHFRNVLFWDLNTALSSGGKSTNRLEHATLHRVVNFRNETTNVVTLTNCLLISVTNNVSYTGAYVETNWNDSGIFQTVGAGARYLATNSTYRNSGTANIDATLSNELKRLTTYPPIIVAGSYTNDLTFSPQAQRDTDTPDLGYHYSPMDYAVNLLITNATVRILNGAALGTYSTGSGYSLSLMPDTILWSEGSPTNLNRIARYNTIQEQANSSWTNRGPSILTTWFEGTGPRVHCRFTEFSVPAQDCAHFNGLTADSGGHDFRDCEFHGGTITSSRPTISATNCLFNRTYLTLDDAFGGYSLNASFRHSTFFGGTLYMLHQGTDAWTFKDNLFDNLWITNDSGAWVYTNDYNGYTTNVNRLAPNGPHDVLLASSNVNYQAGPLGYFYLPTSSVFLDKGTTNANYLTLFHFTTATNQVRETNTIVDLGYHYVALTNGVPIDGDGDGLGDYQEDANGNGANDSGESNLALADTDGDGVSDFIEILQGRNPNAGAVSDTNGLVNLRIYTPLK